MNGSQDACPLNPFWSIQCWEQILSEGGKEDTSSFEPSIQDHPSHGYISFPSSPMSSHSARKIVHASGRNLVADGFYPVFLSTVHSAAPDLPLDPVVFRSLLLCILAPGGRNLLLRSHDEDVSLIQNITALVGACSAFLILPPHKGVCERHVSIPQADRGSIC